ncbi:MAG: hypothetical protein H6818_02155 [Phycisphaerales bacterium]|nr:hypothetical protein [Phycisphaerales bacterium]MCB9863116.1 hypothetical protein [Phycisphaerales bacterium]
MATIPIAHWPVDGGTATKSAGEGIRLARLGLLLSVFSAVVFVAIRAPQLPVHFQVDGQLAEYLAWSKAPASIGDSFNQELNPRLFSVYYPTLGFLARYVDRLSLLRGAFAIELVLLAAAVFYLTATMTRNALAGSLASIAVIWGNGMAASLGGSSGVGLVCNPEFPATAAICAAMALSWRGKHVWACVIAGLAFNVHGSIALFGAAMVCSSALIECAREARVRRALIACVVCAIAASPTVVWVLATAAPTGYVAMDDWLRFPKWIYPLHIFVSDTPLIAWLRLAVLLAPGVMGWSAARDAFRGRLGIVQGWLFATAILLAIGYLFVEVWPVRFVAQLTLWRGTRFVLFGGIAIGVAWLVDVARAGGVRALLSGVALTGILVPIDSPLAASAHAALAVLICVEATQARGGRRLLAVVLCGVTLALLASEWSVATGVSAYMAPRWIAIVIGMTLLAAWASRHTSWIRSAGLIVFAVAACAFVNDVGAVRTFDGEQKRRAGALLDLAPAIRRSCPAGRTVVAPPDLRNPGAWADRGSFLCRQQLTVYAYGPWLVDRLFERMAWYLGEDARELQVDGAIVQRLADGYRSRTTASFGELRDRYGVGIAIVELGQHLDYGVVAENDVFRVYDLSAPLVHVQVRSDGIE